MTAILGNPASPANEAIVVAKSDTVPIGVTSRALFVGTGGDLSVEMAKTGSAMVFKNVPSGSVLPIAVTRVNSTLTTATDIVALY